MSIFEKNKNLLGLYVNAYYKNGDVLSGIWSEWWSKEDNISMEDEGKTACESILLEEVKNHWADSVEILETEIKDIRKA